MSILCMSVAIDAIHNNLVRSEAKKIEVAEITDHGDLTIRRHGHREHNTADRKGQEAHDTLQASSKSGTFIHRKTGRLSATCNTKNDCEDEKVTRNRCMKGDQDDRCKNGWGDGGTACGGCDGDKVCCTKTVSQNKCCGTTRTDGSPKQKCKAGCPQWVAVSPGTCSSGDNDCTQCSSDDGCTGVEGRPRERCKKECDNTKDWHAGCTKQCDGDKVCCTKTPKKSTCCEGTKSDDTIITKCKQRCMQWFAVSTDDGNDDDDIYDDDDYDDDDDDDED